MSPPKLVKCNLCGHSIRWMKTPLGKSIPIDPQPSQFGGNIVIRDGLVVVLKKGEQPYDDEEKYKAHFTTCTVAIANRKKIAREKKEAERKAAEPPSLFDVD